MKNKWQSAKDAVKEGSKRRLQAAKNAARRGRDAGVRKLKAVGNFIKDKFKKMNAAIAARARAISEKVKAKLKAMGKAIDKKMDPARQKAKAGVAAGKEKIATAKSYMRSKWLEIKGLASAAKKNAIAKKNAAKKYAADKKAAAIKKKEEITQAMKTKIQNLKHRILEKKKQLQERWGQLRDSARDKLIASKEYMSQKIKDKVKEMIKSIQKKKDAFKAKLESIKKRIFPPKDPPGVKKQSKFSKMMGKVKAFAAKAMKKVKEVFMKIKKKVEKWMEKIAQADAFPKSIQNPMVDVPTFGAAGRKPANAARAAVGITKRLSAEATKFNKYSQRAADAAAAEAASADAALADADAAKYGAENDSYAYSMALSLNRFAGLVKLAIDGNETFAEPQEKKNADEMVLLTNEMSKKVQHQVFRMRHLEEEKDKLSAPLAAKISLVLDEMEEQMTRIMRAEAFATRHKQLLEGMRPPNKDPPNVPQVLLRHDGTPWWPDQAPATEMPDDMIMMKPKPGVYLRANFL